MADTMRAAAFLDKGGVGKTTAVAHLGVALDNEGYDVLLIDLAGKQGDLAKSFGLWETIRNQDDDWPNVSTVFDENWDEIARKFDDALDDLIWATGEGPDLIPAHHGLDTLDSELNNIEDTEERYSRLNKFLDNHIDDKYDVVLIDLPGLTNNVTYNGIWATQNVVAPIRPGPFEADQIGSLEDDIELFEDTFGMEISIAMLLPNEVDERTTIGRKYLEHFESHYPDTVGEHVPKSEAKRGVQGAQDAGQTVFAFPEEELVATGERAREAYVENARQLADRLGGENE